MLAFAGLLFAVLLSTVTEFVNRHTRMGDKPALAAAVLLVVGTVVAVGWFLAPQVAEQTDELQRTLPKSLDRLTAELNKYESGQWVLEKAPGPDARPGGETCSPGSPASSPPALSAVGAVVVVFFIGLYLAAQPRMYFDGIARLVTVHKRDRAKEVMGKIVTALRWWLMGKLAAMVFVGVLVWLMLLLGLPFALPLNAESGTSRS